MEVFSGKRYFIYGNGVSGKAAARAIKKLGGRAKIYTDKNGEFSVPAAKRYDGAVISPGIMPTHAVYEYCKNNGIPVSGEPEIGFAAAEGRTIVGVTGTNGKTTVTRLIAEMLRGTACGNIGYPISAAAFKTSGSLVCELSSFQLNSAVLSPSVAVITNIAEDHMDWHGSMRAYCQSKCNIANNMRGGYLVLGEDVPLSALDTLETSAEIVNCSSTRICDGAYIDGGYFWFMGNRVCPVDYLRLVGAHNLKNALCAIAAAKCAGAENSAVLAALSCATPAPHRTERVGIYCGKLWIDDSKGTNISACLAAVEQTVDRVCLITGGRSKSADFRALFKALNSRVTEVIAMGEAAQDIRNGAVEAGCEVKLTVVDGLFDAVKTAARSDAETVLLSPACSSFDEFDGYAERGEKFKAYVKALGRDK